MARAEQADETLVKYQGMLDVYKKDNKTLREQIDCLQSELQTHQNVKSNFSV